MPKKLDLANTRVGRLTVLYPLEQRKNGKVCWHCRCDCGNEVDIISSSLNPNNKRYTASCGCLQKENTSNTNRMHGLEGMRFGYLIVLNWNNGKWLCKCDCGKTIQVNTQKLKSGHTQSCGCYQKKRASETFFMDYSGRQYGALKVLERAKDKETDKTGTVYKCQCNCGNITYVRSTNLISNGTWSCGCLKRSHGEFAIQKILEENNIDYQIEYRFKDCINPVTNTALRFDFYVNEEYLIEFDGEQHYRQKRGEPLQNIQERDRIKNEWCKSHNIHLIRIPYYHLSQLTLDDLKLDTSKFLVI